MILKEYKVEAKFYVFIRNNKSNQKKKKKNNGIIVFIDLQMMQIIKLCLVIRLWPIYFDPILMCSIALKISINTSRDTLKQTIYSICIRNHWSIVFQQWFS